MADFDGPRPASWNDWLYPSEWERSFCNNGMVSFGRQWWWMGTVASSLYLAAILAGGRLMRNFSPLKVRRPLAVWNLILAVFSFIGVIRVIPHLTAMLYQHGLDYTLCRSVARSYGHGPCGLWVSLFCYSKFVELFDTAFLIARKKNVIFLHWYHHCTVLLYCWHAYMNETPMGIYFVAMNYAVHSVMYFYYFLAAVLPKPPQWALFVTIIQLLQMAVGIAITVRHYHLLGIASPLSACDGHLPNVTAAFLMYASYFLLFAQFFAQRYCTRRLKPAASRAIGVKQD